MKKIRNILVPTDFSVSARNAFHYAQGLAEALDANLTIVHVKEYFLPTSELSMTPLFELEEEKILAEAIGSHILTLLLQGMVKNYYKPQLAVSLNDKPLAFAPARQVALDATAVRANGIKSLPNRFHQTSGLNEVQWTYLGMLDGKRTTAQVQEEFLKYFRDGRFTANQNGSPVTDDSSVSKVVDEFCKAALKDFVRLGLMD